MLIEQGNGSGSSLWLDSGHDVHSTRAVQPNQLLSLPFAVPAPIGGTPLWSGHPENQPRILQALLD